MQHDNPYPHTYLYNIIIPLAVHAESKLLFFFTYLHKRHEVTKGTQKNTNMRNAQSKNEATINAHKNDKDNAQQKNEATRPQKTNKGI